MDALVHVKSQSAVRTPSPLGVPALVAAVTIAVASLAGGCVKPVLSPDEDRTQFDRYDGIRAQYAPQYTSDEFGIRRPNLRGRLGPKE